jgi:PAS domain S-box-containing protein
MNNFYGGGLTQEELQRQLASQQPIAQQPADLAMGGVPAQQYSQPMPGIGDSVMMQGNYGGGGMPGPNVGFARRQSLPSQSQPQPSPGNMAGDRRMSMMDYGNMQAPSSAASNTISGFTNLDTADLSMSMSADADPWSQPGIMTAPDAFSPLSPLMPTMMDYSGLGAGQVQQDPSVMSMFSQSALAGQFHTGGIDNISTDFSMDVDTANGPLSARSTTAPGVLSLDEDEEMTPAPDSFLSSDAPGIPQNPQMPPGSMALQQALQASMRAGLQPQASTVPPFQSPSAANVTPGDPSAPALVLGPGRPPAVLPKAEKSIYSKSGFDMIRALYYVATRPKPEIQLGAVDLSCAFVVCDVTLNDCPIIYVSENFQNLTGYNRHEILGQNCRFLQAPDGKVEAGTRREYVENNAVYNLKMKIKERKEVQQSLINYRKGGKPFLNLLTMIPIPWDDADEIRFFIGFQIDLVECPDAIGGGDGQVSINYKHRESPLVWEPPQTSSWSNESGQTMKVDDVSTLLQQFTSSGGVSEWHRSSWDKMLLENSDDVIHVLSLKGIFQYVSPACKRVLGYDSEELVGTMISAICHPSDIVPVTRELKETAVDRSVSVVFRIRCKTKGFIWFESHGSLFPGEGKGRKCIILVGRKRPVFALRWKDLNPNGGGVKDSELWTKISTSGMFLFVPQTVRQLLDLQPEELQGTSMQELMRKESRQEFGVAVEKARRGQCVEVAHEVTNKRGQVLQAVTFLYPGDAPVGHKPSFLLAQTRLMKASPRGSASAAAGSSRGTPSALGSTEGTPSAAGAIGLPAGASLDSVASTALVPASPDAGLQDDGLDAPDIIFEELKSMRATSWQFELRQLEKMNRQYAEELQKLNANKKKRKRRKGTGGVVKDCANCHTMNTPEWRRGPSGNRDLCNSCGLRYAKQVSHRSMPRGSCISAAGR